jgi:toxin ParE1/3/4
MAQVSLSVQAVRDLKEISKYIANQSNSANASAILRKIASAMQTNAIHPLSGRTRNELSEGLRSFSVAPYIVFYRPLEDGIRVIRVLHSRRDLNAMEYDEDEPQP